MSNERRSIVDNAQLAELFRSYADMGVRAFDPGGIAAHAIADGRRHRRWGLSMGPWPARRVSLLVAIGLLVLGAAVALVGSAIRLESRPVPGLLAVSSSDGAAEAIRLLDPDGTSRMVFPSTGHDTFPVWSPDGTRIAYTDHRDGPVRVVNADGTGARSITDGYTSEESVAWSPDGREIAFMGVPHPGGGDIGLYLVNTDGTGLVRLLAPGLVLGRLAWSPDGSLISGVGGNRAEVFVHVVDPRTGVAHRVSNSRPLPWGTSVNVYWGAPSWSPDSTRLLYSIVPASGELADIAVAKRTGSGWVEQIVVSKPLTLHLSPLWLDDDRFVFLRDGQHLVVANGDGSGQRELVRERLYPFATPCVAPDGSRVAVAVGGASNRELLVVAVDGALPSVRLPSGSGSHGPACSWQGLHR